MLSRLMTERWRPVATLHTAEAQDSSRVCSVHDSDTLNVDDEVLRKRMEKIHCCS